MFIIIGLAILVVLKLADVSLVAEITWWHIGLLAVAAFIWFEFIERWLGLDKRRENIHFKKIQEERARRAFQDSPKK